MTAAKIVKMDPEELKRVLREVLDDKFRDVGIIAHDDDAVEERRRDFRFLHDFRKSAESAKSRVGAAFLLTCFTGLVSIVVLGFKTWARQP